MNKNKYTFIKKSLLLNKTHSKTTAFKKLVVNTNSIIY